MGRCNIWYKRSGRVRYYSTDCAGGAFGLGSGGSALCAEK